MENLAASSGLRYDPAEYTWDLGVNGQISLLDSREIYVGRITLTACIGLPALKKQQKLTYEAFLFFCQCEVDRSIPTQTIL